MRAIVRLWSRLLVALALSGCATGQPAAVAHAAPEPSRRPLPLWAIESPDGQRSYILGTHHLGVRMSEVLPPPHIGALDDARVLMVEMDIAQVDPAAMAAHAMLPADQDLQRLLPAQTWQRLVAALRPTVPEMVLHRMRPWTAMATLMAAEASNLETERNHGASNEDGPSILDVQVMERARERNIPVVGLETVDQQAALMDSIPVDSIVEYIEAALNGPSRHEPTLRDLTAAYLRGDEDELEALVFDPEEMRRSPQVFDALIYQRNRDWLERIEGEVARGRAFIAVGLGHVIGDRGLLRLLREHRYRVERLYAD
jgi:uncharacterized protein YbaP (TraB family)